jgi:aquaporin Z
VEKRQSLKEEPTMGEPITDERLLELENNLNRGTADERQAAQAVPGLIARIRVETTKRSAYRSQPLLATLRHHWPEYLMEAVELGLFMISVCFFVVLLEHPASPVHQAIPNPFLRRVLVGIATGLTAVGIIYSPLGQRSGAHFNPSVTLTFLRLGKIAPWDAFFYAISQFVGGLAGVLLSVAAFRELIAHESVRYAVTVPGMSGILAAFLAEVVIAFMQMSLILRVSNTLRFARFTGILAGIMVATYISVAAPYSGMSMNPARTFASALPAHIWTAWWVYFTAPPLGMLLASALYVKRHGLRQVFCAKLHHHNNKRCIFRCNYGELVVNSQHSAANS